MNRPRSAPGRRARILGAVLAALFLTTGCGRSPRPADPGTARKTLQTTLDAWKDGKTPDALTKKESIKAVDQRWAEGYRLRGFEITGEEAHGYDRKFQVTLRLEGRDGKSVQETAAYNVATSPQLVVVRNEDF